MCRDTLVAEKVLTYIYQKLCDKCKEKLKDAIVDLGLETAEDLAEQLHLSL